MPDTSPTPVDEAISELRELTECLCDEAWTERELHHPDCSSEYRADVETVVAALRSRASIGPDSERIEQVIADALDGYLDAELTRELAAESVAGELRDRGLLLGPDDIAVSREALAYVLKNVQPNNTHPEVVRANIKALRAALSEPQPKPEGAS